MLVPIANYEPLAGGELFLSHVSRLCSRKIETLTILSRSWERSRFATTTHLEGSKGNALNSSWSRFFAGFREFCSYLVFCCLVLKVLLSIICRNYKCAHLIYVVGSRETDYALPIFIRKGFTIQGTFRVYFP